MEKIKICVVWAGMWGTNHIRTLLLLNVNVGCVDTDLKQLQKVKSQFHQINWSKLNKRRTKRNRCAWVKKTYFRDSQTEIKIDKATFKETFFNPLEKPEAFDKV